LFDGGGGFCAAKTSAAGNAQCLNLPVCFGSASAPAVPIITLRNERAIVSKAGNMSCRDANVAEKGPNQY
jgi:hypothetical protein